jgi:2-haloacid dehalogenase
MTISAVVFDIGNVLIRWKPEAYYDATIGVERRREMFAEVDLHGLQERIDAGADFKNTFYQAATEYPNWHSEIRQWVDRWNDIARPELPHSVALLRALRANGVPVFALTNFGVGSFALSEQKYPFLREFDKRYVSGAMMVSKPDPEIYRLMEIDCGVPATELLFADDRADNIATAHSRGWQTHLFEHPQGWADRLVHEGLLTEEKARFDG